MKFIIYILLSVVLVIIPSDSVKVKSLFSNNANNNKSSNYLNAWNQLEQFVSINMKTLFSSSMITKVVDWLNTTDVNPNCSQAIAHYLIAISNMDYWAIKMLDSSGKIPSGILSGTLNDMGSYDQCVDMQNASYCIVDIKIEMPSRKPYHSIGQQIGQYFNNYSQPGKVFHHISSSYAHFFYYLYYRMGICLPSICSQNDIYLILQTGLKDTGLNPIRPHCEQKIGNIHRLLNLDVYQFISLIYITTIICFTIIGSLKYTFYGNIENTFWVSFSLQNNIKRLITKNNSKDIYTCLHGIRLFSIIWVVFGHCYGWISFQIFRGSFAASDYVTRFWFQPIMHGSLAVNTFFLISGLLTMNGSLYYYKKAKKFNILVYVFHRIWRFIPLLALTLSLTFTLPLLGSGPIWHETVNPVVKNCEKNWWKTLLLINYLIDSDNICLLHTWYLGCDFHFYLLALIVVLPVIYNRKKLAIINNSLLIILGTIITGIVLYKNNYPPTLLYAQPKVNERLKLVLDFYIKPYSHIGSYCIGLFLALIIAFITPKQKKLLLSPKYLMLGWIITSLSFATILFSIYPWNKGEEPNIITSVIYGSIHRTLWSISIAWIVFVCVNGYGGVVNKILSFSAIIPFSRLTYAVFLIHPIVHWMKLGTLRERIFVSHYDGLYAFIPTLVLTFGFSMICGLLCESPFLAIEQFFIKKFIKSKKQQQISHNFDL